MRSRGRPNDRSAGAEWKPRALATSDCVIICNKLDKLDQVRTSVRSGWVLDQRGMRVQSFYQGWLLDEILTNAHGRINILPFHYCFAYMPDYSLFDLERSLCELAKHRLEIFSQCHEHQVPCRCRRVPTRISSTKSQPPGSVAGGFVVELLRAYMMGTTLKSYRRRLCFMRLFMCRLIKQRALQKRKTIQKKTTDM